MALTALRLYTLGGIDLRSGQGRRITSVLAQPKRFALLTYLAVEHRARLCRREVVLSLLWPQLDDEHARHALRQALSRLRQSLGPEVMNAEGDHNIGVVARRVRCDATRFESAVRHGRLEGALKLFRGEFLEGFHLADCSEFDHWLDGRRAGLERMAAAAAGELSDQARARGDLLQARRWARRCVDVRPYDESAWCRLMTHLEESGDRAGVLLAFEELDQKLRAELDLSPSPETCALKKRLLSADVGAVAPTWEPPVDGSVDLLGGAVKGRSGGNGGPASSARPGPPPAPEEPARNEETPPTPGTGEPSSPPRAALTYPTKPGRRWRMGRAGVAAAVTVATLAAAGLLFKGAVGIGVEGPPIVLVLPIEALSDLPADLQIARGISDEILARLTMDRSLTVHSQMLAGVPVLGRSSWPDLGRDSGARLVVYGTLQAFGDRASVHVHLLEPDTGRHLWVVDYDEVPSDPLELQREIGERVIVAVKTALQQRDRDPGTE